MKAGVIVFPGTNCDRDTLEACQEFGWEAEYIWHDDIFEQSSMHASTLRGEADLQYEQRTASVRKSGEGEKQSLKHSHSVFQAFVPHAGIHPSPQKGEGAGASNNLNKYDVIFLPGGFSYGDYVRSGALAKFSPVIEYLKEYIEQKRGFVVGICNGFQILCEAGLLPGALTHNEGLKFICADSELILNEGKREEERRKSPNLNFNNSFVYPSPLGGEGDFQRERKPANVRKSGEGYCNQPSHPCFTPHTSRFTLPIAHAEGRYVADEKTIQELKEKEMIFLTYKENPNGSVENIAGLYDKERRIIGMMPHPERAFFKELGNEDGKIIFDFIEKRCV